MKILLLGKNAQVGWDLQRCKAPVGEVIALDHHSQGFCSDLSQLQDLAAIAKAMRPDLTSLLPPTRRWTRPKASRK
jgi:dTDP-4-dehydrorhamnose reductase